MEDAILYCHDLLDLLLVDNCQLLLLITITTTL